eukprot:Nk52_evm28s355 gene=Nk52_evmTU28s355
MPAVVIAKPLDTGQALIVHKLIGDHSQSGFEGVIKYKVKGKIEDRILVLSDYRLYLICEVKAMKIEVSTNFLEIAHIQSCKEDELMIRLITDKFLHFKSIDADVVIGLIYRSMKMHFPNTSVAKFIKIDLPHSRQQNVFGSAGNLNVEYNNNTAMKWGNTTNPQAANSSYGRKSNSVSDNNNNNSASVDIVACSNEHSSGNGSMEYDSHSVCHKCDGFTKTYRFVCDYFLMTAREEVIWDVDNIYFENNIRELNLEDFPDANSKDFIPIIRALEYNKWFTSLRAADVKLSSEVLHQISLLVGVSPYLEMLTLNANGAGRDFFLSLGDSMSSNSNLKLNSINLANNRVEDRGVVGVANALQSLSYGFSSINLSHCSLTSKGITSLSLALKKLVHPLQSLKCLNLSDNVLNSDGLESIADFLAVPNCVTHLNLSNTSCAVDSVFWALERGCTTHLKSLNLSHNRFCGKQSGPYYPPASFQSFLKTSKALQEINLSHTHISVNAVRELFASIISNGYLEVVSLHLQGNDLGVPGAQTVGGLLSQVTHVVYLDFSDNDIGDQGMAFLAAGLCLNRSLVHLSLDKNVKAKSKHRSSLIGAFVDLLCSEESAIESLSIADNKLKCDIVPILDALSNNEQLSKLDISGNNMSDRGALALSKALQVNQHLSTVSLDDNQISIQGFTEISLGLTRNTSVKNLPMPFVDISHCLRGNQEITLQVLRKIESSLCRNRNPVPNVSCKLASRFDPQEDIIDDLASKIRSKRVETHGKRRRSGGKTDDPVDEVFPEAFISSLLEDADASHSIVGMLDNCGNEIANQQKKEILSVLQDMISRLLEIGEYNYSEAVNMFVETLNENCRCVDVFNERAREAGSSEELLLPEFQIFCHDYLKQFLLSCDKKVLSDIDDIRNKVSEEFLEEALFKDFGASIIRKMNTTNESLIKKISGLFFEYLISIMRTVLESKESQKSDPSESTVNLCKVGSVSILNSNSHLASLDKQHRHLKKKKALRRSVSARNSFGSSHSLSLPSTLGSSQELISTDTLNERNALVNNYSGHSSSSLNLGTLSSGTEKEVIEVQKRVANRKKSAPPIPNFALEIAALAGGNSQGNEETEGTGSNNNDRPSEANIARAQSSIALEGSIPPSVITDVSKTHGNPVEEGNREHEDKNASAESTGNELPSEFDISALDTSVGKEELDASISALLPEFDKEQIALIKALKCNTSDLHTLESDGANHSTKMRSLSEVQAPPKRPAVPPRKSAPSQSATHDIAGSKKPARKAPPVPPPRRMTDTDLISKASQEGLEKPQPAPRNNKSGTRTASGKT